MTSTRLGIIDMLPQSVSKEDIVNSQRSHLEQATQDDVSLDFTSGDVALTENQQTRNRVYVATNLTVARTLTLLTEIDGNGAGTARREFVVDNSAGTATLTVNPGTIAVGPGETALMYLDGANVQKVTGGTVYDLAGGFETVPAASQRLFKFVAVRPFVLPAGLTNSQAHLGTAATAQTDYSIRRNETEFGVFRFAAAGTVASILGPGGVGSPALQSFAIGDRLDVLAPAVPDATAAGLGVAFAGRR